MKIFTKLEKNDKKLRKAIEADIAEIEHRLWLTKLKLNLLKKAKEQRDGKTS